MSATCGGSRPALRPFPDRPVAWQEHDDTPFRGAPAHSSWSDLNVARALTSSVTREVDRYLTLEGRQAALDVNALDEVPCSTWFCPRNHVRRLDPAQVGEGPSDAVAPRLPFTVVKGKEGGTGLGFVAKDADGRQYMVKFDPFGWGGLATGADAVGQRLAWAAGYPVP